MEIAVYSLLVIVEKSSRLGTRLIKRATFSRSGPLFASFVVLLLLQLQDVSASTDTTECTLLVEETAHGMIICLWASVAPLIRTGKDLQSDTLCVPGSC